MEVVKSLTMGERYYQFMSDKLMNYFLLTIIEREGNHNGTILLEMKRYMEEQEEYREFLSPGGPAGVRVIAMGNHINLLKMVFTNSNRILRDFAQKYQWILMESNINVFTFPIRPETIYAFTKGLDMTGVKYKIIEEWGVNVMIIDDEELEKLRRFLL